MATYEYDVSWLGPGAGTAADPYIIKDLLSLDSMRDAPGACYVLVKDVEILSLWEPFDFSGELDGRGHTISGLEIDKTDGSSHYGLFSSIGGGGYVHDLNITTGRTHVRGASSTYGGVLCGILGGMGRIERVMVSGTIDIGGDRGGGLAGYVNWSGYLFENAVLVALVNDGGSRTGSIYALDGTVGYIDKSGIYSSEISGDAWRGGASAVDLTIAQLSDPANYPVEFNFQSGYWEIVDGLPRLKARPLPGTLVEVDESSPQASKVSGIVQIDGTPAERTVRAFGYQPTAHDLDGEAVSLSKSLGHATSAPDTGEYTIDLLAGYGQEIFVVAFDNYGEDFVPELAVAVGDRVHPTTPDGHVYECTGAGTLPSEEPAWITDTETGQLYGSASMIARPFYRPMVHGPVVPEVTEQDPAP